MRPQMSRLNPVTKLRRSFRVQGMFLTWVPASFLSKAWKCSYETGASVCSDPQAIPQVLVRKAQRLQYPLIKEYTLSHIRDPTMI